MIWRQQWLESLSAMELGVSGQHLDMKITGFTRLSWEWMAIDSHRTFTTAPTCNLIRHYICTHAHRYIDIYTYILWSDHEWPCWIVSRHEVAPDPCWQPSFTMSKSRHFLRGQVTPTKQPIPLPSSEGCPQTGRVPWAVGHHREAASPGFKNGVRDVWAHAITPRGQIRRPNPSLQMSLFS